MNVVIRDTSALLALVPGEISTYLRSRDWSEKRAIEDRAVIWIKRNEEGEEFEALVPQQSLDDYVLRMMQLLHTLSVVEERSELDIYADIHAEKSA